MKVFSLWFSAIVSVSLSLPAFASGDSSHSDGESSERIVSLDATFRVKKNGTVDVGLKFVISVEGKRIKRGPCLNFITVFKGPAGLVLDNRMKVTGVFRNGQPEDHFEVDRGGQRSLFFGSEDVILEHGLHEYEVAYTTMGEWKVLGGEAAGAFDFGGPFRGFGIETAKLRIVFPEGVQVLRYSPAVKGFSGEGSGFESELNENELLVEVTDPLAANHAMFINAVWTAEGFSRSHHWMETLRQHPKLPLALLTGGLLLWALFLLVRRFRREAVSATAAR